MGLKYNLNTCAHEVFIISQRPFGFLCSSSVLCPSGVGGLLNRFLTSCVSESVVWVTEQHKVHCSVFYLAVLSHCIVGTEVSRNTWFSKKCHGAICLVSAYLSLDYFNCLLLGCLNNSAMVAELPNE